MGGEFSISNRLAAIVYDEGVAIDLLLPIFARELIDVGSDARSVVEALGGGLRAEFALALRRDCVVLTAIERAEKRDWLALAEGRRVVLDPRLSTLRGWWSTVARDRQASARRGAKTSAGRPTGPRSVSTQGGFVAAAAL